MSCFDCCHDLFKVEDPAMPGILHSSEKRLGLGFGQIISPIMPGLFFQQNVLDERKYVLSL